MVVPVAGRSGNGKLVFSGDRVSVLQDGRHLDGWWWWLASNVKAPSTTELYFYKWYVSSYIYYHNLKINNFLKKPQQSPSVYNPEPWHPGGCWKMPRKTSILEELQWALARESRLPRGRPGRDQLLLRARNVPFQHYFIVLCSHQSLVRFPMFLWDFSATVISIWYFLQGERSCQSLGTKVKGVFCFMDRKDLRGTHKTEEQWSNFPCWVVSTQQAGGLLASELRRTSKSLLISIHKPG